MSPAQSSPRTSRALRGGVVGRRVALAVLGLAFFVGSAPSAHATAVLAAPVPAAVSLVGSTASGASTSPGPGSTAGFVDVIDVNGYIDPVTRDSILRAIDDAVAHKAEALVIQLNSPGSLLPPSQLDSLEARLRAEKRVPVTVWVGGYKARARGGAARIVAAASVVGVASGTSIGHSTRPPGGKPDKWSRTYSREEALKAKVAQIDAPVLVQFVGLLDGRVVNGKTLDTATESKAVDGRLHPKPHGVRFAKLSLVPRLLHTATNPSVAYLLFVIALSLFVFEFFTGGIGIAAGVGLAAFALAVSGLGNLPTRPLGVGLLALSTFGFAVDVQAGTPRFWTAVGTISLVIGSLTLYGPGAHVPLYFVAIMVVMVVLFMVNGMPTMVRTRFATPTIGREAMIGELGEARDAIDPEGVVTVKGAPWRARTNRATPIAPGGAVRVVAIDGLLLEVEPLEGAAKDARH